jgi:hypothetical protein
MILEVGLKLDRTSMHRLEPIFNKLFTLDIRGSATLDPADHEGVSLQLVGAADLVVLNMLTFTPKPEG